jgi:hypothetical protein
VTNKLSRTCGVLFGTQLAFLVLFPDNKLGIAFVCWFHSFYTLFDGSNKWPQHSIVSASLSIWPICMTCTHIFLSSYRGLCDDWKAKSQWVHPMDGKGVPNLDYLCDMFGTDVAPVHEQRRSGFTATRPLQKKMNVAEHADWWNSYQQQPDDSSDEVLLYLKDWKFVASRQIDGAYEWPDLFQDDWLNQAMGSASKFVYLGPKGTSTLLHADVLRSFSW